MCRPVDAKSPGGEDVIDDQDSDETPIQSRTTILAIRCLLGSRHSWRGGHDANAVGSTIRATLGVSLWYIDYR